MKRLFAMILVSTLLLSGCTFGTRVYTNETEPEHDPDFVIVRETDQIIQEINVAYADGRTERVEYEYERYHLEPAKSASFYENDEKVREEHYRWDEHGNLISVLPDGDPQRARNFALTYDENGNITEKRITEAGVETGWETFSYDDQNRVTEWCEYEGETLTRRTVTEYGDDGRRQNVTVYDGSGAVAFWQEYDFDEKKYSETVLEYDADGTLLRRLVNGYNIGNVVTVQEEYDGAGNLIANTYWRFATHTTSTLDLAE